MSFKFYYRASPLHSGAFARQRGRQVRLTDGPELADSRIGNEGTSTGESTVTVSDDSFAVTGYPSVTIPAVRTMSDER